jgi:Asp-tRNA(Asn)/Glu-tRNA(Gln) amidotransferase C subunit
MRDDNGAHESGEYSKEILEQAPNKEGNYIKVKKIL